MLKPSITLLLVNLIIISSNLTAQTANDCLIYNVLATKFDSTQIQNTKVLSGEMAPDKVFEAMDVFIYGDNFAQETFKHWRDSLSKSDFRALFKAPVKWREDMGWARVCSPKNSSKSALVASPIYSEDGSLAIVYNRNVSDYGWHAVALFKEENKEWVFVTSAHLVPDFYINK